MATPMRSFFYAPVRNHFKLSRLSSMAEWNITGLRRVNFRSPVLLMKAATCTFKPSKKCREKSGWMKVSYSVGHICQATWTHSIHLWRIMGSRARTAIIAQANTPPCLRMQRCVDSLWKIISISTIPFNRTSSPPSQTCAWFRLKKWNSALTAAPRPTLQFHCTRQRWGSRVFVTHASFLSPAL